MGPLAWFAAGYIAKDLLGGKEGKSNADKLKDNCDSAMANFQEHLDRKEREDEKLDRQLKEYGKDDDDDKDEKERRSKVKTEQAKKEQTGDSLMELRKTLAQKAQAEEQMRQERSCNSSIMYEAMKGRL